MGNGRPPSFHNPSNRRSYIRNDVSLVGTSAKILPTSGFVNSDSPGLLYCGNYALGGKSASSAW